MAEKNPLRYRGYYYDSETGFYYLQSRYYDPANRRFVNADSYTSTGQGFIGTNMFTYCLNNPVNYIDSNGEDAISITAWVVYALLAFAVSAYGSYIICYKILPYAAHQWGEMIDSAGDLLVDALSEIGESVSRNAEHIRDLATIVTSSVRRSYAAQSARKYSHLQEVHHIVARRAKNPYAVHARSILAKVGININSQLNLVGLKTGLHRRLHTTAYYALTDTVITEAYESAKGDPVRQRQHVIAALNELRLFLLAMNRISPY